MGNLKSKKIKITDETNKDVDVFESIRVYPLNPEILESEYPKNNIKLDEAKNKVSTTNNKESESVSTSEMTNNDDN